MLLYSGVNGDEWHFYVSSVVSCPLGHLENKPNMQPDHCSFILKQLPRKTSPYSLTRGSHGNLGQKLEQQNSIRWLAHFNNSLVKLQLLQKPMFTVSNHSQAVSHPCSTLVKRWYQSSLCWCIRHISCLAITFGNLNEGITVSESQNNTWCCCHTCMLSCLPGIKLVSQWVTRKFTGIMMAQLWISPC